MRALVDVFVCVCQTDRKRREQTRVLHKTRLCGCTVCFVHEVVCLRACFCAQEVTDVKLADRGTRGVNEGLSALHG